MIDKNSTSLKSVHREYLNINFGISNKYVGTVKQVTLRSLRVFILTKVTKKYFDY